VSARAGKRSACHSRRAKKRDRESRGVLRKISPLLWIPAFAGMTFGCGNDL
jgi:hypothetical protein